ncbi:MAG: hypothetical protein HDR01_03565 [Lachnospiraceae bacterium]|nr:hypothetical protein [Lachnospiraceae bacterium]
MNYTDAAIEKMEKLATDVRQQRAEKAAHEPERTEEAELISPKGGRAGISIWSRGF